MEKFQLRVPKKIKANLLEVYIKIYKWKLLKEENRIFKESKINQS